MIESILELISHYVSCVSKVQNIRGILRKSIGEGSRGIGKQVESSGGFPARKDYYAGMIILSTFLGILSTFLISSVNFVTRVEEHSMLTFFNITKKSNVSLWCMIHLYRMMIESFLSAVLAFH